jgi:hypothetical protein
VGGLAVDERNYDNFEYMGREGGRTGSKESK